MKDTDAVINDKERSLAIESFIKKWHSEGKKLETLEDSHSHFYEYHKIIDTHPNSVDLMP